jgi:hypothetical protein
VKKFDELLAGVTCLSLINEPPQPVEVEARRLTAREIADRRWKMERSRNENLENCRRCPCGL